jgi:hypothetical protein
LRGGEAQGYNEDMSQNHILTDQLIQKMRSLPEADQRMLLVLVERLAAAPGTTSTNGVPVAPDKAIEGNPPLSPSAPKEERKSAAGRYAHLGLHIPKEVIDEGRREMWANFPRDLPVANENNDFEPLEPQVSEEELQRRERSNSKRYSTAEVLGLLKKKGQK